MLIQVTDFNGATEATQSAYGKQWQELEDVLGNMPLHVKASGQAGRIGRLVFDPIGSNRAIKEALSGRGWRSDIPIPLEYGFLGRSLDVGKEGVIGEIQFSNYPFLVNNLMRADMLYKVAVPLTGVPTGLAIIVTKARMFHAAQSSLDFDLARRQLDALSAYVEVPTRLVGLFEERGSRLPAVVTEYTGRTSRTVIRQESVVCEVVSAGGPEARSELRVV